MSKNKKFSEMSVKRYSLALYEVAFENKSIKEIEEQAIAIINLISKSSDFNFFVKDPTNKKEDLFNLIQRISEKYKFNNIFCKFLNFLIEKRRFFFVEKILKDFIKTCSKKKGEVLANLITAKKIDDTEINKIKEDLAEHLKAKIKLNYKYDQSLIGGLIIQIDSIMVDTSIKNKLQKLENKMIEA